MKLFSTIIVSSCLAAQAFGVSPVVSKSKGLSKPALVGKHRSPLRQKNAADISPLFRDPTVTRGGAIPGLDAYSEALDKNPITTKALTSLAGWFLGDLLAQVRYLASIHITYTILLRALHPNEFLFCLSDVS
jgi:protein Mpv17